MSWLPFPRSSRWWILAGASGAIVTMLFWFIRFSVMGQSFSLTYALRFLLLGAGLCLALGLLGWLGLRRLWLCATMGIALGLLMMGMASGGNSGWEDLISLMNFFVATGFGIAVGVVLELVVWMFGIRRQR